MGPIGLMPPSPTSGVVVDASAPPIGSTTRSATWVQAVTELTPAITANADAVSSLERAWSMVPDFFATRVPDADGAGPGARSRDFAPHAAARATIFVHTKARGLQSTASCTRPLRGQK